MADYVSRFKGAEIDDGVDKGITVGKIADLTTTEKGSVVGAVNELDAEVGTLADLMTTEKTNLVGAINEVDANVGAVEDLETEDKSNTVVAINEVLNKLNLKGKIFSSTQLSAATGVIPISLLNSDANFTTTVVKTLPANFLKKNKIIKICVKGVFSCIAGATANLSVKLGDIVLKSIVEQFPNNKIDYYYEKEIYLGARTEGISGAVIMQGRSIVQDGASGQVAMIPLALTAPVAVDTTQKYQVEIMFNWNTENVANNLRVSEATIEVL